MRSLLFNLLMLPGIAVTVLTVPTATGSPSAQNLPQISVRLHDQTRLSAALDTMTSKQFLVLRFGSEELLLQRKIPWPQVVSVTVDGQLLTADEFQETLKLSRLNPETHAQADAAATAPARVLEPRVATISSPPAVVSTTTLPADRLTTVESLQIYAQVANWDRDAAADGILVSVRPLNAAGQVVPAAGILDVQLIGQAFLDPRTYHAPRHFDAFPELGDWRQLVSAADFQNGAAVYRFEFRRTNPDIDSRLGSYGLTHARFSIPGHGVFEASDAMTVVRPFSVYRDWHQQLTGNRFLPAEHVRPQP